MTIRISTQARNLAGASVVNLIDQGSDRSSGFLEVRSGQKPISPQSPPTGVVLASAPLAIPAFRQFKNGVARANAITDTVTIINSGTATWFRIYSRDNVPVIDGDVAKTGEIGDLIFDYINFVAGGVVQINNLFATMPE